MGPINMMALEEYNECEQRFGFLGRERDRPAAIHHRHAAGHHRTRPGLQTEIRGSLRRHQPNFATAFHTLFGGGTGEMRLSEPDSSGDAGIDVVAQPPGQAPAKRAAAFRRRKGDDRAGAADRHLPLPAEPVLHPGRSRRAARRSQRRPLHETRLRDERGHAVHRRDAQPPTMEMASCSTASPCRSRASRNSCPSAGTSATRASRDQRRVSRHRSVEYNFNSSRGADVISAPFYIFLH